MHELTNLSWDRWHLDYNWALLFWYTNQDICSSHKKAIKLVFKYVRPVIMNFRVLCVHWSTGFVEPPLVSSLSLQCSICVHAGCTCTCTCTCMWTWICTCTCMYMFVAKCPRAYMHRHTQTYGHRYGLALYVSTLLALTEGKHNNQISIIVDVEWAICSSLAMHAT